MVKRKMTYIALLGDPAWLESVVRAIEVILNNLKLWAVVPSLYTFAATRSEPHFEPTSDRSTAANSYTFVSTADAANVF